MNNEKIYHSISNGGITSLVLGIVVLATGVVAGTLLIISGAKLIKQKYQLTF